ncbi:MAG: hypothetical protein CEO22_326 [Candidatus Berkelbacteria bacterium Gr01-1014_85]|uniref:Uncharacterized protein n=1 Tax=Candidatus Berkelbacteria bacterium Gr01-1014_85 TaxID=2017150 RepID=A0A554JBV5_9BACT|nr:MAG: hypothetical protein CEO22_326 [Candidatus Berkelbacteria bacterium Gr01-1014_85]
MAKIAKTIAIVHHTYTSYSLVESEFLAYLLKRDEVEAVTLLTNPFKQARDGVSLKSRVELYPIMLSTIFPIGSRLIGLIDFITGLIVIVLARQMKPGTYLRRWQPSASNLVYLFNPVADSALCRSALIC